MAGKPVASEWQALAKLTLSLRITGVRPDGYHLLDAEMVTVDLADTLYFSAGDGLEVGWSKAAGAGMAKCHRTVPTSSLAPWRSWGAEPTSAWSNASRPAPAWVAGRPMPPLSCDGRGRTGRLP